MWKRNSVKESSPQVGVETAAGISIVGSVQSQKSLSREAYLRKVIKQFTDAQTLCEKDIAKMEVEKARRAKQMFDPGYPSAEAGFKEAVAQISHERELIASYQLEIDSNQAELDELIPSPEQAQAREKQQNQFAQLSAVRLEQDRAAYEMIEELRGILEKRGELSAKMNELAQSLDMAVSCSALDSYRFNAVLDALPGNRFSGSEAWKNWFLGQSDGLTEYIVIDDKLTIQETLVDSGFRVFGDRIKLREEEARELLRGDRPMPHKTSGGPLSKSPGIMSVDDFEALSRKAQEDGISIKIALMWAEDRRKKGQARN